MSSKISVLLVNLNNLSYTKQCLEDLLNQEIVFNLRLIDQNSSEIGTKEFFNDFFTKHSNGEFYGKIDYLEILNTGFNKPLNLLWNDYVKESSTEFICFLNNDVRIPPNFLSSSISVLEKEPSVGFVNHVTNNLLYSSWSDSLEYTIMETPYRQGWDPIFRKTCYNEIPEELKFFYGDDYIYSKLYSSGYKGAYVLNSPMIHFERSTTTEKGGARDCSADGDIFQTLDLEYRDLAFDEGLCRWKPEYDSIDKVKNSVVISSPVSGGISPKLSILICTVKERKNKFLDRLLSILIPQTENKPVEVLILTDEAEMPIGEKRNLALSESRGKYLCFIDDDDYISSEYVDSILEKIEEDRDVIVFDAIISFDGDNPKPVKYGIEFKYGEGPDCYYRNPNHLMVHKSEITDFFLNIRTGEDDEWAKRRLKKIKTQSRINKILYYYDFRTTTRKYFMETNKLNPLDSAIDVNIQRPPSGNLEGTIYVKVNPGIEFFSSFPLYFTVQDISNRVIWETELYPGSWSLWPWITWTTVKIVDSLGSFIYSWEWDPIKDGCISHQLFHLWSLKNRGSFGIAIGTHDGTSGEWVGMVKNGMLRALLIEASENQFIKLNEFYSGKKWVRCENKLITVDGKDLIFYEGGTGHTNSVKKSHIEMTVEKNIREVWKSSESLISLLEKNLGYKWLHIDVEGIDDELILSLEGREDLLPEVIVYEHESLPLERENILVDFLEKNNFKIFKGKSRNTICFRGL
jgi:GT2 family glycosyltransferase